MRSLFATWVVLAHAALLFSVFHHKVVVPTPGERVTHTLIEPETEFVEVGSGEGVMRCRREYEGFGFEVFYGVVMKVGHGYPAEFAGLKPGDIVYLNGELLSSPVLEGDPITFDVTRGQQRLRLTMHRQKVCLS